MYRKFLQLLENDVRRTEPPVLHLTIQEQGHHLTKGMQRIFEAQLTENCIQRWERKNLLMTIFSK